MRPTEILSAEHRVIERVLDCLEGIAATAARGPLDVEAADQALRVLRTFADACHHGKEEDRLFPRMKARGMPTHVGPVAVMLAEHELGRAAIRGMSEGLASTKRGEAHGTVRFVEDAHTYVALLRQHIAKEDQILFPMAESILTDADRSELLAEFASFEHNDVGAGTHEEMLGLVDGLCARLGIKPHERDATPLSGCCAHAQAQAQAACVG